MTMPVSDKPLDVATDDEVVVVMGQRASEVLTAEAALKTAEVLTAVAEEVISARD